MIMISEALIGTHAFLGEAGALMFLWVLVEMINPTPVRLKRAKIAAKLGTILFVLAWIVGGYYYVKFYGPDVKPIIKAGPQPWAHGIAIETKEHVFLFLPFLAVFTWGILRGWGERILQDVRLKRSVLVVAGLIVLLSFAMAGLGVVTAFGFRSALEAMAV